jgi:hypothetical protein
LHNCAAIDRSAKPTRHSDFEHLSRGFFRNARR